MSSTPAIRVLVVDDHTLFRRGLIGVIVFFLQIDTVGLKNSNSDKHLQSRLSRTPRAFGAN